MRKITKRIRTKASVARADFVLVTELVVDR